MVRSMSERLAKSDWIKHGLRTLAGEGAHALRVGPMADALKVSRGSFYWHFRDIADFRAQLLESWQERMTEQVIQNLDAIAEPGRLAYLMQQAFSTERSLDRAVRSWATTDTGVADLVAAVDSRRVAYHAKLLVAAGVENTRAQARATFMYWAYLGQPMVMDAQHASVAATEMSDLSALFER
jgi:AcrR family transcriptional regulator